MRYLAIIHALLSYGLLVWALDRNESLCVFLGEPALVLSTFDVLRTYTTFHSCWDKMRASNITCKGGMNSCVVLNYLKCVLRVRSAQRLHSQRNKQTYNEYWSLCWLALVTAVRSHNLSRFTIQQVTVYKGDHTQYCCSTMISESAIDNVALLKGNEDAAKA